MSKSAPQLCPWAESAATSRRAREQTGRNGASSHGLEAGSCGGPGHRYRPGEGLLRQQAGIPSRRRHPAHAGHAGGAHDPAGFGMLGRGRADRGERGRPTGRRGEACSWWSRTSGPPASSWPNGASTSRRSRRWTPETAASSSSSATPTATSGPCRRSGSASGPSWANGSEVAGTGARRGGASTPATGC